MDIRETQMDKQTSARTHKQEHWKYTHSAINQGVVGAAIKSQLVKQRAPTAGTYGRWRATNRQRKRMCESVRERMKREDDGRGNKESKTDGKRRRKSILELVSLPEADLLTSWLIFRGSQCSGMVLQNRYQIYCYINTPSSLTNSKNTFLHKWTQLDAHELIWPSGVPGILFLKKQSFNTNPGI